MKGQLAVLALWIPVFVSAAHASTIPCTEVPLLSPDGIRVCSDAPQLEASIYALPGSTWNAWANDNPASDGIDGIETGDGDYNDAYLILSFSAENEGTLTWIGSDSTLVNIAGLPPTQFRSSSLISDTATGPIDIGTFAYGEEVVLELITPQGGHYYSGSGRNQGVSHWWIEDPPAASFTIPEPATAGLLGAGFLLLGCASTFRRNVALRPCGSRKTPASTASAG